MTTEPVAWDLAERVAGRVGGREPFGDSYHVDSLLPDFQELTREAEQLVTEETGLVSASGPARVRVTDRAGWVHANIGSMRRMLSPLTTKVAEKTTSPTVLGITRRVTAVELGALLGWMSTRVLGQYDLLLVEDEHPEDQDLVYYVGPNVLSLEKRFGFPPREFRLWLALHEVTHRAQFTGVPWLRPYFLSQVDGILGELDPGRMVEGLRRAVDEVRAGRNPLDDGGLPALFATPEQREVLDRIGGLMSLLEGHGDVTMDRAGADRIPSAERFSRVLRARRANRPGPAKLVQKLVGLEAKMKQYELGEHFIAEVEAVGGPQLLARVWEGADRLPTMAEIREPAAWLHRVAGLTSV
ncbi:MAG: Coenzyme biosynthesis-associated protein [Actinomycetia bacterium]|nr:Coenzyme biosynthesis-associated protein [Actinomycetes bacterium]